MNLNQINVGQLISQLRALVLEIVGIAILVLICAAVARFFGSHLPGVPNVDQVALAYLCGAYWLYRKAAG